MTAATAVRHDSLAGQRVWVTPWAVVRFALLVPPALGPAAAEHAELVDALALAAGEVARLRPLVEDELFALAGSPPRPSVLAVRRAVHNGREPRPAALADLGAPTPALARWLAARASADTTADRLRDATAAALAADRAGLAALCGDEALRRAAALVSPDLVRAVTRAAERGTAVDRRAAKSEPRILRHALRAATRTTPLTWSAGAAWGRWTDAEPDDLAGALDVDSRCEPDRRAVDSVAAALQAGDDNPVLHLAPGSWVDGDHLVFHRPVATDDPTIRREEQVRAPLNPALRALLRAEAPLDDLVGLLAGRLPPPAELAAERARGYLARLTAAGILVPVPPLAPQDERPLATLARYATELNRPEVAAALRAVDTLTAAFPATPADARPAALATLRARWADLPGEDPPDPLTEDVGCRRTLGIDAATVDLPALAPVFELFDAFTVIRRAAHDRFVARFGVGGTCPSVARFAADYAQLWRADQLVGPAGELPDPDAAGPALRELAALRRAVVAAVEHEGGDAVLGPDALRIAADGLPGWLRSRPASYSVFAQPLDGGGLCVNQVYGGWGRFASRFLPGVDPVAAGQVAATIRAGLGPTGARPAQVRPCGGFNANLHPRLVADEIGDAARWGTLHADDLDLVHDPAAEQVRIRHRPTGDLLDVLYLGFLVPLSLPQRLVPILNDLSSGLVDLRPLCGTRRLRAGSTVLSRRRWRLSPEQVDRFRADLDAHRDAPGLAAARLRAESGLPRHVFVGAAGASGPPRHDLSEVIEHMGAPRPQYVDLGSALHLACLARTLTRFGAGVAVEEALPAPRPGRRVVEYVVETYRP